MSESKCARCGAPLGSDDAFCGDCGIGVGTAPAQADPAYRGLGSDYARPGGVLSAAPPAPAGTGAPFFRHEPRRPPGRLNNTTRYLCAAAYLDNGFANQVIRTLIASRRAVAPSVNLDLGPVIFHCRRARHNLVIRNLAMIATMVIALVLSPPVTLIFALYAFAIGWVGPRVRWRQRGLALKLLIALIGLNVLPLLVVLTFAVVIGILAAFLAPGTGADASPLGSLGIGPQDGTRAIGALLFTLVAIWGIEAWYAYVTRRTLVAELALGAPAPATPPATERIEIVEGAQWGNIALYATEDPFIGAGLPLNVAQEWSIAIRLDPADAARQVLRTRPVDGAWVPINPLELHQAIREKVASLNDPGLPVNERIAGLSVTDRLVGAGVLRWDNPLIDMSRLTPFSHASPEAIAAIMQHPQAGLRYYQHVTISDESPAVMWGDRKVLDAADQGITISAFVYAAVEGRHFYLQFILTALPPILGEYRAIDFLPSLTSTETMQWVVGTTFKRFLRDAAESLGGLFAAYRVGRAERKDAREALRSRGTVAGQLGAEVSIRELGTATEFGSYIRELDVKKYIRILDRVILDAAEDFLARKGVDTSAFSSSAANIINGDVIGVHGNNNQVNARNSSKNVNSPSSPTGGP